MIVITAQLCDPYRPDKVIAVLPTPVATEANAREIMESYLQKVADSFPMLPVAQFITTEIPDGATEPNPGSVMLFPVTVTNRHRPGSVDELRGAE